MRCFVALELPEAVRAALAEAAARLRRAAPRADVRWVPPASLHLTVRFLGEVSEALLADVIRTLRPVAAATDPIPLGLAGLGVFPGPARPRVVWAGVETGRAAVGRLAGAVEEAVRPLGFPAEVRPFAGHVTLARVRSPRGIDRLLHAMESLAGARFGGWTAADLVVFRSHLGRDGARYEALVRLPLGAVACA